MGLGNVLFGRKKLKGPARDRLFALTTAAVTLDVECGLKPAGVGAIVFKPLSAGEFTQVDNDVEQLLQGVASELGLEARPQAGHVRLRVGDRARPRPRGSGDRGVRGRAGVQRARLRRPAARSGRSASKAASSPVYWIYGFKTGTFWPFVPTGEKQERDNARELELKAKLEKELPVEQDLTKWFALFDAPI